VLKNTENKENHCIGAVSEKQACVWMDVSRAVTQMPTSNVDALFMHLQVVQLTVSGPAL
jgi:hypothetical protein